MFTLLERLVGRDLLWRFGRRLYHHARREGSLDLRHNGEAWLQRRVARHAAAQTRTLTIVDVGANYGQWSKSMIGELAAANAPRADRKSVV